MRLRGWTSGIVTAGLLAAAAAGVFGDSRAASAAADWTAVEHALGKAGTLMPGGVYRVGFPRTDLTVTVHGIRVEPAFALGSYAAFKEAGAEAMMMGDLVLRDEEVTPVLTRLLERGLTVTAVHNHLNEMAPHVMYLHYGGHGDAGQLAAALRDALSASGTPLGSPAGTAPAAGSPGLDPKQLEAILGRPVAPLGPKAFQASVARAETITEDGIEVPPAMGVGMPLNFQALEGGKAAVTGDFVLIAREVNPVARALRAHGIEVTALHSHTLGDEPRLFYMHFWAQDDALRVARGLRAALDLVNTRK